MDRTLMFSDDQKKELAAPLNRANVSTRKQGGRELSYIEGWHAIDEANRIFGFDGWTRETLMIDCVNAIEREIGENKVKGWGVTYTCKVRIRAGEVIRDGCGSGHGIDRDLGLAHESALKEAETDAMKRALMTFGNPFGLALYDKSQANVESAPTPAQQQLATKRAAYIAACEKTIAEDFTSKQGLLTWWNSEAQKKVRRDYSLSAGEIEVLKAKVIARAARFEVPS